jgi:hypothetical protein
MEIPTVKTKIMAIQAEGAIRNIYIYKVMFKKLTNLNILVIYKNEKYVTEISKSKKRDGSNESVVKAQFF